MYQEARPNTQFSQLVTDKNSLGDFGIKNLKSELGKMTQWNYISKGLFQNLQEVRLFGAQFLFSIYSTFHILFTTYWPIVPFSGLNQYDLERIKTGSVIFLIFCFVSTLCFGLK